MDKSTTDPAKVGDVDIETLSRNLARLIEEGGKAPRSRIFGASDPYPASSPNRLASGSQPRIGRSRVRHARLGSPASVAARLTQSSAMRRQVVHLPPVIVSRPGTSTRIVWSRDRAAVLPPPATEMLSLPEVPFTTT